MPCLGDNVGATGTKPCERRRTAQRPLDASEFRRSAIRLAHTIPNVLRKSLHTRFHPGGSHRALEATAESTPRNRMSADAAGSHRSSSIGEDALSEIITRTS